MFRVISWLGVAAAILASPVSFGHGFYCSKKTADGSLVDLPTARSRSVCQTQGGMWKEHDSHCHLNKGGGKFFEVPNVIDEAGCQSKGGSWNGHGPSNRRAE